MENEKPSEAKKEDAKTEATKLTIWENHIKGWLFSLLGYAILIADFLDLIGMIDLPVYDGLSKGWQILGSFLIAALAFLAPRTFETKIEGAIDSLKNKVLK